ncbi:MAG: tyrosine-type recombinase/integrase [Gammaproteobacteria bacterium]|nr:tyrosine-type recombinase/integrase [Gammaproteobacteria bacterium]MBU1655006.1 tyrosine-type recombinase/integrase [Gammaproteobacteria bacterium]MBU1960027.1 tyrosine-type recombinase/integrase [Gammaproteobacteria bacterium]
MANKKPDGLILRNGWWYVQKQVRYGDQRVFLREATGSRERAAAEAYRDRRIVEIMEELRNPKPIPIQSERSFQDAAVEYVLSLERRGKNPERAIYAIKSFDPFIGHLPLSHVHQGALGTFEADCRDNGLSSGTVARAYVVVVSVLNHAARVLRDGPEPWLKTAVPRIVAPDWDDRRQPYRLTWNEQDRLIAALEKPRRQHLIAPVLFGLWTGTRQGEITGFRWAWEQRCEGLPRFAVWRIPAEVRKGSACKTVSQQEDRYLVANAAARSIIEVQSGVVDDELVFPGPRGGGEMYRITNNGWRSAWTEAGLPKDGYVAGVHNLRHTFTERLAETGTSMDLIKRVLGHESGGVTARYTGPMIRQMLDAVELVTRENVTVPRAVVTQITTQEKKKAG